MIKFVLVIAYLILISSTRFQSNSNNQRKRQYKSVPLQSNSKYRSKQYQNRDRKNLQRYKQNIVQNGEQLIKQKPTIKAQRIELENKKINKKSNAKNIVQNIIKQKQKSKLDLIAVIGGPGSGKGTHSAYMQKQFGFKHISLGDLFRAQIKNNGPLSAELNSYMLEGKLVPSELGVKLIINQLNTIKNGTVLLDGFPRNAQNMQTWTEITKNISSDLNINTYLYFDCPIEVMETRLIERGKISGRGDDNIQIIRKRLKVFQDNTVEVFSNINKCQTCKIIKIDSNNSIEQISKQLHAQLLSIGYKPVKAQGQVQVQLVDQTL